ncbi:MAG: radical SAM protein [Deltaproteobacteria bacterium]
MLDKLITKSLHGEEISAEEIALLFEIPLFSKGSAKIIAASRWKSERACDGLAEVHAQVGLNIAPCPRNCAFCAFAEKNKVFATASELSVEEAVTAARQFEEDGANAIYVMATADYPFPRYIEMSGEIRKNLKTETVLVANIGDLDIKEAWQLKDVGYSGIYHAVRLGEGFVTSIPVEQRLRTLKNAQEAGLTVGTCVEPVGTEHGIEELVEKTLITRDASPCFSGAARRIPIPGTELAPHGMVSEARMAHILAVVRLAVGFNTPGNCTHEPNVIGAAAGANLLWAESGSNPRDTEEKTEEKRGMTVQDCMMVFREAEWQVLQGPSKFYSR